MKQFDFIGTRTMIDFITQEDLDSMDAEDYSYYLAFGMTQEQHEMEDFIAYACSNRETS